MAVALSRHAPAVVIRASMEDEDEVEAEGEAVQRPLQRVGQRGVRHGECAGLAQCGESREAAVHALAQHRGASPAQRLPALVYLAELRVRTGRDDLAAALLAEIGALDLTAADRETLTTDLATAAELAADLG